MLLEIRESRMEPDITVVQLSGRLELGSECQRIESLGAGLLADGVLYVMLDLTRVEYIDSAGIGVLAMTAGQLKRAGGGMVLVLGEGKMKAMLQLTGLDAIMPLADSPDHAAELLRAGSAGPPLGPPKTA
jgi:anti-sigma B factor antagonist